MKRLGLLVIACALAAGVAVGQTATGTTDVAVKAGRALDVRTGKYLVNQVIWIHDGRIQSMGDAAEMQTKIPAGARAIDLSQMTVLPGLIDCHTHLTDSPYLLGPAGLHTSIPRMALLGARNARVTLEAGFTTVRNVGADGYSDIALRDAINAGDVPGPRILASGPPLSITGGHGDENFLAPQYHYSSEGVVDGPDAAIHRVRENIKFGADVIKVIATGGVLSEGDNPQFAQLSPEELRAAVETAHGLGRKVAAHAHGALGIKNAVLAGVDSIEHGSYINEEDIQLMKQHGTYLVPTLETRECVNASNYPQEFVAKANQVLAAQLANFRKAVEAGVKIAFGTDIGVCPFGKNGREFNLMVQNGMTPMQAIQS
ncbi:MAG: amidohydrolase family protein, partial [Bryobacteraceae bacterium]